MFLGKIGSFLLVCALVLPDAGGRFMAATAAPPQESQAEQALRKRVEGFFGFWQAGNWVKAEDYVTEESKETFLAEQKGTLPRFEVESLALARDQQSAKAVIRIYVLSPFSPQPFPFTKTTQWRQVNGVWLCDWQSSENRSLSDIRKEAMSPPAPEQLKFKGHKYWLGQIHPDQIKAARYPFTNVTDHDVKLTSVLTGCKCLQVKTEKEVYKAGEPGELVVEFNPTGYQRNYLQTMLVKTDPGDLITHLTIGAFVIPPPREGANPSAKPAPAVKRPTLRGPTISSPH